MPIVVIGLSHHSCPVEVRERFAFAEGRIPDGLRALRESGAAQEAVILSTCNRVELYVYTALDAPAAFRALRQFMAAQHSCEEPAGNEAYSLVEPQSVHHLFRVACGLDSMVLGETEILGQLKKAYDIALQNGHTGGKLNRAFQRAFNVAKHIRTETSIQRGNVSVGSVAVELAEKIFNSLEGRNVMVIGAGDTSEKTARSLLSRGAGKIVVTNRSYDKAEALAAALGGRAVPFEDWAHIFAGIDIVISSTSAPHYVLDRAKLAPLVRARGDRPLLLIDIAVPRDIEPEVNFLDGVYLYNIDDLQAIADDALQQRKEEVARCEKIIEEKAAGLLAGRPVVPGSPPPAAFPADSTESARSQCPQPQ
jgi:glutamyl-tRNA reductase